MVSVGQGVPNNTKVVLQKALEGGTQKRKGRSRLFEGPGLSLHFALVLCGTTNLHRFGGGGGWSAGTAFRRRIFLVLGFLRWFLALVWILIRHSRVYFLMQSPHFPFRSFANYDAIYM